MAPATPICDFGEPAKPFDLPATDGKRYTLDDVRGPNGTLVMFICNHCPYVKAVLDRIIRDAGDLQEHGIGAIAIYSNEPTSYPDDSFANMKRWRRRAGCRSLTCSTRRRRSRAPMARSARPTSSATTPRLELQYGAGCDAAKTHAGPGRQPRALRGDASRSPRPAAGPSEQIPSMGCSIKWKAA